VLDSDSWRGMGIARALDRIPGIIPVLERDLGDQTWSKSLARVVLVAESAARTDSRKSLHAIRRKFPHARILVHGDADDPGAIAEFLTQGADGYFVLSLGEEKLVKAIRLIAHGSTWVPETAIAPLIDRLRSAGDGGSALSRTERELLQMLAEGLSNKQMAERTNVAEVTVKTRLTRLYRRFSVRTRVQLLAAAIRSGLIPPA
jgi:two-component system, NarL family, response regulator DevR